MVELRHGLATLNANGVVWVLVFLVRTSGTRCEQN